MSEGVITDVAQLTPERLTAILRREGVLDRGEVRAIDCADVHHRALPRHLTIGYLDGTPTAAPPRLFLKMESRPEIEGGLGQQEVAIYRALSRRRMELPMV